jgi:hypothetical protein
MWEKLKLYTKMTLFGALALYILAFILMNKDRVVDTDLNLPLIANYHRPSVLLVLPITAILSIVAWSLIRTIFKTIRQFRALKERQRTAKLEKEVAEMRAKAEKLQTRPATETTVIPPSTQTPNP